MISYRGTKKTHSTTNHRTPYILYLPSTYVMRRAATIYRGTAPGVVLTLLVHTGVAK